MIATSEWHLVHGISTTIQPIWPDEYEITDDQMRGYAYLYLRGDVDKMQWNKFLSGLPNPKRAEELLIETREKYV